MLMAATAPQPTLTIPRPVLRPRQRWVPQCSSRAWAAGASMCAMGLRLAAKDWTKLAFCTGQAKRALNVRKTKYYKNTAGGRQ